MKSEKLCPCGSNIPFSTCCKPIFADHAKAKTAEQLMRSRYTAFTMDENAYLLSSWAKETRPEKMDTKETPVQWIGLDVESSEKGEITDSEGTVTFIAHFIVTSRLCHLREKSRFIKEDNKWFYLDGVPDSSIEKIARNGLCPCGSGKKFKRCCL